MNNLFTIKQAAEIVHMTSETLRHYDRIGLVKPCLIEESSQYRYYSEQELVRLQTIALLKQMDMSLTEIKEILCQDDLSKVIAFLKQAEKNADEKIARLQYAKSKIKLACADYEKKLSQLDGLNNLNDFCVKKIPERTILISDRLEYPTLRNLWNYHSYFYQQLSDALRPQFLFEDMAGMITRQGRSRLFAVCVKYPDFDGLVTLPAGNYLCGSCTEETKDSVLQTMMEKAKKEFDITPQFIIHNIVVNGILQWSYQIQLLLEKQDGLLAAP